MADLQVLEQQQREAQRKLESARLLKVQRHQRREMLQTQLEEIKFSNGELRAQLRQSRELLSTGTRALGARRLVTDQAGSHIRDFEDKLKRGLQATRVNAACQRKVDSILIVVENKLSTLSRLKVAVKQKVQQAVQEAEAAVRQEERLRHDIQKEATLIQELVQEQTTIRAEISEAEKELLEAQNLEESTRIRAEALEKQVASEKKQIDEKAAVRQAQLQVQSKQEEELMKQNEILEKELEALKLAQGFGSEDDIQAAMDANHAQVQALEESTRSLDQEMEEMKQTIHDHQELILANVDQNQDGVIDYEEFLDMVRGKNIGFGPKKRQAFREVLKQTVEFIVPYKYAYQNQYSCSPPPFFMIGISLLQIVIFCQNSYVLYNSIGYVGLNGPVPYCSSLIYNPDKRGQIWRYLTYSLIHSGVFHAVFNILVQLVLGIPLEMVHGN